MQCPQCGTELPAGGTCPACGWVGQQLGQQVVGPADEPTEVAFPDVCETPEPAPEVPVPYPETGRASDQTSRPTKVEGDVASMPGAAFTPSEGDEPGTGGPGGGIGRLPRGANPLIVVGIVLVVVILVIVTVYLLAGDGNGNGNGGPGPDEGLIIDTDETSVESAWEPTPGFHLSVLVRNDANASMSLDDHDLLVTVLVGTEEVGRTTMALSGDLAPGYGRGILANVGVDLTSGQTYEVKVQLRKDGTKVDEYSMEVTVPLF